MRVYLVTNVNRILLQHKLYNGCLILDSLQETYFFNYQELITLHNKKVVVYYNRDSTLPASSPDTKSSYIEVPEDTMKLREAKKLLRERTKALKVIEALASDDACEAWSAKESEDPKFKKILNLYKVAHLALGECKVHPDWPSIDKAYRELVKANIISPVDIK